VFSPALRTGKPGSTGFTILSKALSEMNTAMTEPRSSTLPKMVQRAGLREDQVPVLDVLSIDHSSGTPRAKLVPRGLWIIGANGRLEFRVLGSDQRVKLYYIVDTSLPLSGAEKAEWQLIDRWNILEEHPLTEQLLREVVERRADARD
jgi:hypothetical protein